MFKRILFVALATLSLNAFAIDDAKIRAAFLNSLGLSVNSVADSPVKGLYEVFTERGLFFSTADGSYIVYGKLFNLANGEVENYNEIAMAPIRKGGLDKYKGSMIVYPAKDEKYVISVFTDLTCGFCRRMHSQMAGYNELGITVRYLAYPRNGLATQDFIDIRSVFCAADANKAMDDAKLNGEVAKAKCDLPISDHFNFGRSVGVSGTPAIVLEDGTMIPGYKSPADMMKMLAG